MQQSKRSNLFSSKWAMILTCMGMAVGTGNIWRFPKQVAVHGGGSFLIPWFLFLFLWSIPLLMVELSLGQRTRKGPFGAFAQVAGPKFAWMGGFVSLCAMMIMCYYAVVTGWTLRYLWLAVQGQLNGIDGGGALQLFDQFVGQADGFGSAFTYWQPWLFFLLALILPSLVLIRGTKGIERLNRWLMPALILILIFGAVNALFLKGAGDGLGYLFSVEPERLGKASHWIAGLTQSAWSTGAGWGLMLSYAVYAREQEDPVSTPMATGFGNNGIELIVALLVFPALFAILGGDALQLVSGASSKGGISFQVIPMLFGQMPLNGLLNILFFAGLAFAAVTSLIAMMELSIRFFMDFGWSRRRAMAVTLILCLILGSPSAVSLTILDNQDYVWGVGLILSGLFLAFLVLKYGPSRFCKDFLERPGSRLKVSSWFTYLIAFIFVEGLVLLGWWLWQMRQDGAQYLWTGAIQWTLVILVLVIMGPGLSRKVAGGD